MKLGKLQGLHAILSQMQWVPSKKQRWRGIICYANPLGVYVVRCPSNDIVGCACPSQEEEDSIHQHKKSCACFFSPWNLKIKEMEILFCKFQFEDVAWYERLYEIKCRDIQAAYADRLHSNHLISSSPSKLQKKQYHLKPTRQNKKSCACFFFPVKLKTSEYYMGLF